MNKIGIILKELEDVQKTLPPEMVDAAIEAIRSHARIFTYATGRSGLMTKAFSMRLMQLGYISFVIGETTTPSVKRGDLLVIASASGETQSVIMTARSARQQGVDLFVISSSETSSLSKVSKPDVIIETATKYSSSPMTSQPLGSLFEQMVLIYLDAVVFDLSVRRRDATDEMAMRHASLE